MKANEHRAAIGCAIFVLVLLIGGTLLAAYLVSSPDRNERTAERVVSSAGVPRPGPRP